MYTLTQVLCMSLFLSLQIEQTEAYPKLTTALRTLWHFN